MPAPPADHTEIAVLGPLALARNGEPVTERDLRRERVRALLAFLVGHRTTSRAEIMAALWPDLDERAAANNLRVTMTYLLQVLEPGRPAREPAYHIRVDGQAVMLVTSNWLRIDVDRFNEQVTRAARAEADGTPSLALEHNLAAAALYRGEPHEGVADADWIAFEREHFRVRFVAAATRAGELLVARGDVDEAEPWPGVRSRSTPGPRTPTPCWSPWRWPEATAPPPAVPWTGRWRPSPTSASIRRGDPPPEPPPAGRNRLTPSAGRAAAPTVSHPSCPRRLDRRAAPQRQCLRRSVPGVDAHPSDRDDPVVAAARAGDEG